MVWTIPDDDDEVTLDADPEAEEDYHDEWVDIAQEVQIAEGDIFTSDTADGREGIPDIDDNERFEELEMSIVDEDDIFDDVEMDDNEGPQ